MTATKAIKKSRIYLIYGEDELGVSSKAKEIIRQIIPAEEETLGLEMINTRSDSVENALTFIKQCREAIQTVGFLGGRKAVWLRNANFLDQGIIGKSKIVRERLKDLSDTFKTGLPENHFLVITSPEVDVKSEFHQACKAAGEVIGAEAVKPWQRDKMAIPFAARAFRELGLTASQSVIQAFVEKAGTDSRQLQQEAEKLSIYLGDSRTVQREDIDAIISPARELFGWQLEDALGNRDLEASLRILRQLLFQKEEPIKLFFGLESRFRSLFILREALDKGWIRSAGKFMTKGSMSPEQEQLMYQALNDNRLKNPYVAGMRTQQAATFTRKELERSRRLLLETRRQLVSSTIPETLAMEMLIIKICQKNNRPEKGNRANHEYNRSR